MAATVDGLFFVLLVVSLSVSGREGPQIGSGFASGVAAAPGEVNAQFVSPVTAATVTST